jgi:hypothetical protein
MIVQLYFDTVDQRHVEWHKCEKHAVVAKYGKVNNSRQPSHSESCPL